MVEHLGLPCMATDLLSILANLNRDGTRIQLLKVNGKCLTDHTGARKR